MSFQTDITKTEEKTSRALGVIRQIKHVERINTSKLIQVYKVVICPIFEYACPVWQIADTKRLEEMQRKALSLCRDAYASSGREALEVELGVKPLQIRRQELAISEGPKIISKDNQILIKKAWLDWKENVQTERLLSPFGKIQVQRTSDQKLVPQYLILNQNSPFLKAYNQPKEDQNTGIASEVQNPDMKSNKMNMRMMLSPWQISNKPQQSKVCHSGRGSGILKPQGEHYSSSNQVSLTNP